MTENTGDLVTGDAEERILESARRNIEKNGILGLRVADVAENAYCSVTQIYRYFGNRDGLLARVLGDLYEEYLKMGLEMLLERLSKIDDLTVEKVVDALPTPTNATTVHHQGVRLQILAAAVTNRELRERLSDVTKRHLKEWDAAIEYTKSRLPEGTRFDSRVFTIAIAMQMGYYRTLMGDDGFTEAEYRRYVLDKLTS